MAVKIGFRVPDPLDKIVIITMPININVRKIFEYYSKNRRHFFMQPAARIAPLNGNLFNWRCHVEQASDLAGDELH